MGGVVAVVGVEDLVGGGVGGRVVLVRSACCAVAAGSAGGRARGGGGVVDCFCDFLAGDAGGAGHGDDVAGGCRAAAGDAELGGVLEVAGAVGDDLDAVAGGLGVDARGWDRPLVGA